MLYGYARVSTDGQDTAAQVLALRRAGCRRIVEEVRSGVLERPHLERLVSRLRPGDVLVVWKVDRLARSLRALLDVHDALKERRASLKSLTEPIDTGTPMGEAFFQLLGVFAQLERALIRERCAAGRAAARERGVVFGRRRSWDWSEAVKLRELGLTQREIARRLGVHQTAVRAALDLRKGYGTRKAELVASGSAKAN